MSRHTGFVSAVLLAGAAILAIAAPAHAEAPLIACTGSQTGHYAPPIGPLPRQTTVHIIERLGEDDHGGTCTGPFAGGTGTAVFHQPVSCLVPAPGGTLPELNVITYQWHGGQQSTVTFTVTTVLHLAGQTNVNSFGTVTDGYGEGSPAARFIVLPDLNILDCLASRTGQQTGPMVLLVG